MVNCQLIILNLVYLNVNNRQMDKVQQFSSKNSIKSTVSRAVHWVVPKINAFYFNNVITWLDNYGFVAYNFYQVEQCLASLVALMVVVVEYKKKL